MTRTRSQTKSRGSQKTNRYDLRAIEGFILVVHTSLGGDQLVFRYPPVARTSISEETWTAVIGRSKPTEKPTLDTSLSASSTNILGSVISGSTSKTTSSGKTNETPTDPNEPPIAISYADTYSPYNMPSVMLCNILSPKQSICDRIFHTIIDQYRFFGFPTMLQKELVTEESTKPEAPREEKPQSQQATSSFGRSGSTDLRSSTPLNGVSSGQNPSTTGSAATPATSSLGSSNVSGASPASYSATASPSASTTIQHKDELTMFNLVLVVPKEVAWEESLVGQRIAVQIASALRHEQERCHYVSTEVFKMLRLRERWFVQHRRPNPDAPPPSHTALTYEMLQHSSLAQLIKNVYHSIRDEGVVQELVNNWVSLSLNTSMIYLPKHTHHQQNPSVSSSSSNLSPRLEKHAISNRPPTPAQASSSQASPASNALKLVNTAVSEFMDARELRPLRPYHTILILDQQKVESQLPPDCSPALRKVVEKAVPTKSFREMQLELGIPLEHLYRIAAHLVYWKCARVIDVLTRNNIYVLNPTPKDNEEETMHMPFLIQTFEAQFPGTKLVELLSRFSTPKKLNDILQTSSSQSKFVEMVVWLIRRDLIMQVHQFCFLLRPKISSSELSPHATPHATPSASPSLESNRSVPKLATDVGKGEESSSNHSSQQPLSSDPIQIITSLQRQQEAKANSEKSKANNGTGAQHRLSPIPLTPTERLALSQHDNGSKDFKLFLRLCPYFRGAHHLTEIAWRENITKEELLKVIGMYKHFVVTVLTHEM